MSLYYKKTLLIIFMTSFAPTLITLGLLLSGWFVYAFVNGVI